MAASVPSFGPIRLWATRLNETFWFWPLALGLFGACLALLILDLEKKGILLSFVARFDWLKVAPASARIILSVIATAMISAASIVYSLSLLIRTIAASNLGPRLVESYDKVSINRITLGLQLLVFVYCLTVLYRVSDGGALTSVSVLIAIVIAVVALASLVIFVHEVARQSHIDATVADIANTLRDRIAQEASHDDDARAPRPPREEGVIVCARDFGYVQVIDRQRALQLACDLDAVIVYEVRSGDFIVAGVPLLRFIGKELGDDDCDRLRGTAACGPQRIELEDLRFRVMLLVEVALRALSPGVNDVFTAIASVDNIAGVLAELNGRDLTPLPMKDRDGKPRIFSRELTYQDLIDAVFHPLRQSGSANPALTLALLRRLRDLVRVVGVRSVREQLLRHAELLAEEATGHCALDVDRQAIKGRLAEIHEAHGSRP